MNLELKREFRKDNECDVFEWSENDNLCYSQKYVDWLEAKINYTRCSTELKDKEVIFFEDWLKDNCEKLHGAQYRYKGNVLDRLDMRYVYMRECKQSL